MHRESSWVHPDRRALGLGLAAFLAACGKSAPKGSGKFDPKVLDQGFQALAERARPGEFNAAVMDLSVNKGWFWNIDKPFPLTGAALLPIAVAVLAEVDHGLIKLTDHITVRDVDLSPPYSLIGEQWLDRPENLRIGDLLTLALQYGDNTAADVIMNVVGGPGAVTAWLRGRGLNVMRIDRYQREIGVETWGMPSFRPAWRTPAAFAAARDAVAVTERQDAMNAYVADPRDTATAQDAMTFLSNLADGKLLSAPFAEYLLKTAAASAPGALGAGLGKGVRWAHRFGQTATDLGFTPAAAELGLATLPDGRRLAIAAFLAGSTASQAQRDALLTDAGRLIAKAAGMG